MFQDELIASLLKSAKKEPAGLARSIAISSLGIFLYEELSHGSMHVMCKEAINVLLATLRVRKRKIEKFYRGVNATLLLFRVYEFPCS